MARSGFEVQQAAVKALFLREIRTRFGKYRLGYFWAILEPAAHLLILLTIFGYVMHRTMPDISFPVFLINGIVPYFLFSNISKRSISAIESNQGLFNYRPIKPIDTIIARVALESVIYAAVYILLMITLTLSGENVIVTNLLQLIFAWLLLIIFSGSVGIIFMVAGKTIPETQRFLPIILKPLYFISCIMFPLHSIPKEYWSFFLWNPIVHAVELSREAVVTGYVSDGVSLQYLFICTLATLFLSLSLYQNREKEMLRS
ncbi:ABC transporter permease [Pantoea sp. Acro-805]|uniref:Transport permease protein n=1 Tax=Candidatus Pantoea formicae TaxID=2608355 RepID=A0ABX0R4L1_9GAMM|nr:ABC transporter permease [Pantoea formicae]NIF03059.1 ABC transporter permease [Pantoea formicae]